MQARLNLGIVWGDVLLVSRPIEHMGEHLAIRLGRGLIVTDRRIGPDQHGDTLAMHVLDHREPART